MKIKKEITRGLGAVSACLLTVVSIGTPVAEAYEGRLNTVLGIETTKTVSDEGLDVDTDYYKSDYVSKSLMKSFVYGTISFGIMFGMWMIYQIDNEKKNVKIKKSIDGKLLDFISLKI